MSGTIFSRVDYSLMGLMQKIELGEIGLPDIQRPFVWPNAKVRDLFDSMYQGFPVGYLLLWSSGGDSGYHQIGSDAKQKPPNLLIVDGQQRLTSLYAVLKGLPVVDKEYVSQRIYIAFRPTDEKFDVADAAIRKNPEYIHDISDLWKPDTKIHQFTNKFLAQVRTHREANGEELSDNEEAHIATAIGKLHNLNHYPFIALELASTVSEEQVSEVFVRINSQGATLNQADFILTLMSVFWDDGRKELEMFCRKARQPANNSPSPYNHFLMPAPDQLLRVGVGLAFRRARLENVYSVLRGKDMATGAFSANKRDEQFGILKQAQGEVLHLTHWHEFMKCLLRAGYQRASMITSANALLYSYTFFLLGKRDYGVPHTALREVIARWFFMTTLMGRYANSPETEMAKDLNRLDGVRDAAGFIRLLDGIITDTFTEDFWAITLPNELATSSSRSPSLFAYYAALNLLGAKVLFSDLKVSDLLDPTIQANKANLERHHLFPKGYLKTLGITETRDINQIANFALVEWADNISISDMPPSRYFPQYADRYSDVEWEPMRLWHALPVGWECLDYETFLLERRKSIAAVIRRGFECL